MPSGAATNADEIGHRDARQAARSERRLVRNTGFSLAQQVSAMALALLLVPYMLWMLGPERYGMWLSLQLFNILGFAGLAELGFQGAIVRFLARYYAQGDRAACAGVMIAGLALFTALGIVVAAAVIVFANTGLTVLLPIADESAAEMRLALSIMGAGLFASFPALAIKAFFAGRQELATTKTWEFCDRLAFALATLVLLQFTTNLAALVLVEQLIALFLAAVFGFLAWSRSAGWRGWRSGKALGEHLRDIAQLSRPVFAANLASQGFNRLPDLFVAVLLGPVSLTAFQIATRIPRAVKVLQGSLNAAVLPHVAQLDLAKEPSARDAAKGPVHTGAEFVLLGLRLNMLLAVPVLVAISSLAPLLLKLWVGAQYVSLTGYLVGFALFQALFLVSNYVSATLTRSQHFKVFVRINLMLLALLVCALALGLEAGGIGFLAGTLIVCGAGMAGAAFFVFHRVHGLPPRRIFREAISGPVLLSGVSGAILLAPGAVLLANAQWSVGAALAGSAGCIYALLIYQKVLNAPERAFLAGLVRRARG
ncbi:hypothetical protein CD351_01795 [Erythrobacter sp. KY5]|uniref:lipopolysaccharide biosynthesis protein n=1 Tax=Erythrobacter sp. KY5 TaxID=2011159 RepID=UPI000DBF1866|nr:lipopolysaccharide biosynthesis protein [Erythrobacter sp. KY5]AWW73153.1 hypothetical protein CD351_01795 [Erythrobacter sp. KY5]